MAAHDLGDLPALLAEAGASASVSSLELDDGALLLTLTLDVARPGGPARRRAVACTRAVVWHLADAPVTRARIADAHPALDDLRAEGSAIRHPSWGWEITAPPGLVALDLGASWVVAQRFAAGDDPVRVRIRALVEALDEPEENIGDEAEEYLKGIGAAALEPLLELAPAMGRFGQLGAIDVLGELGDPRAGDVLTGMLGSDHDTVREWAAGALGRLGIRAAVPALRAAYDAVRRSGTPLDWTEPQALRDALTALGARDVDVPPGAVEDPVLGTVWPAAAVGQALDELELAGQLVLGVSWWSPADRAGWRAAERPPDPELDWHAPWPELVRAAADHARLALALHVPPGAVAMIAWMDERDR